MEGKLDQLRPGQRGIITGFDCSWELQEQLQAYAIEEGTWVTCCYRSPDGKMTALGVHGRTLALPTDDLKQIRIQPLRPVGTNREEDWREVLDKLLVSRRRGIPIMLMLFFLILWLTISGANVPSQWLQSWFDRGHGWLSGYMPQNWLGDLLLDGVYATAARVLAVMLPPMAIFFPLFALLEQVGLLPRMAFLLDGKMRRCGGCGQQALTMCMGLGCNAVGTVGCSMITAPRRRWVALVTNAMIPCNGRLATLIVLCGIFCTDQWTALAVAGAVVLGVCGVLICTALLGRREETERFVMELPPLCRPRICRVLLRTFWEKTLPVAGQALLVAAPAGAILWLMEQGGVVDILATVFDPLGQLLGLNGGILLAFFLSFPANELLIPMVTAICGGTSALTWQMAVCAVVLTVFHWPCSTTVLTVYQQTKSAKNTAAAVLLPTAVGFGLCSMLNLVLRLLWG